MTDPAWLLRMENTERTRGYTCSSYVARETAKDFRKLQAEVDGLKKLLDAIRETHVMQGDLKSR